MLVFMPNHPPRASKPVTRTRRAEPAPAPETDPVPSRDQALADYAAAIAKLADTPLISRRQACVLTSTTLTSWDAYVSRRQAPQPVGFHPLTGIKMWNLDEVNAWNSHRGRRTPRTTPPTH